MKKGVTNVAASVRQRLLNKAQATGRPFAELLQFYVMERFLYRLSQSSYANKFVLKGALLQRVSAQFAEIVLAVQEFLGPVIECIRSKRANLGSWKAPGPWK